jgi:hypothetical protein
MPVSNDGGDWGGSGKQLTKRDYASMRLIMLTLSLVGMAALAFDIWID